MWAGLGPVGWMEFVLPRLLTVLRIEKDIDMIVDHIQKAHTALRADGSHGSGRDPRQEGRALRKSAARARSTPAVPNTALPWGR